MGYLLRKYFDAPELNLSLELLLHLLLGYFGERLVSVTLYGSILFEDLAPGYGDLDFIAVIRDEITDRDCEALRTLRQPLRSGVFGKYSEMLEGAFLPRRMLDPRAKGIYFWWGGTTGERKKTKNDLGALVNAVIKELGWCIFGEDVRDDIPPVRDAELLDNIREAIDSVAKHPPNGRSVHDVDAILLAARSLLFLREHRFSSKSEAAYWGYANAVGDWRFVLPLAARVRKNPNLYTEAFKARHLERLIQATREAWREVSKQIEKYPIDSSATSPDSSL